MPALDPVENAALIAFGQASPRDVLGSETLRHLYLVRKLAGLSHCQIDDGSDKEISTGIGEREECIERPHRRKVKMFGQAARCITR